MSILDIPLDPKPHIVHCKVCTWIETLNTEELEYFHTLELNYTVAQLARQLIKVGSGFGESTLRKHCLAAH